MLRCIAVNAVKGRSYEINLTQTIITRNIFNTKISRFTVSASIGLRLRALYNVHLACNLHAWFVSCSFKCYSTLPTMYYSIHKPYKE